MIVDAARIDRDEAYQALNMGIGMVLFVEDADLEAVEGHLATQGEESIRIGKTVEAAGDHGVVRWA
jgi:phosphoribosylaminoimidazole (AIR) synthetase